MITALRPARGAITPITRTLAPLTAITALAGSTAAYLSAPGRGTAVAGVAAVTDTDAADTVTVHAAPMRVVATLAEQHAVMQAEQFVVMPEEQPADMQAEQLAAMPAERHADLAAAHAVTRAVAAHADIAAAADTLAAAAVVAAVVVAADTGKLRVL